MEIARSSPRVPDSVLEHAPTTALDIVIQDVASFRIDPRQLRCPGRTLVLVASPTNNERLHQRGQQDAFDDIVVTDDFSVDALCRTVEGLIHRHGRDRGPDRSAPVHRDVTLLCHDEYSLRAVAAVREKLGIPGAVSEQLAAFVDKIAMKEAVGRTGVRIPRHLRWQHEAFLADRPGYLTTVAAQVGWPAFVKPLDESGSVGTALVSGPEELASWADRCGGEREYEVDEFLSGTLYHVDSVIADGQITFAQAFEYRHPCYDYLAGRICASVTLPESDPVYRPLLDFNRQVLDGLGDRKPANTVTHHEIYRLDTGELVFLEIAARAPAALIPYVYERHRGFNIELVHFQVQRGERPRLDLPAGPYGAWVYFGKRAGRVVALHEPDVDSAHELTWHVAPGDRLDDPTDIRESAATMLLWNDDLDVLNADLDRLENHVAFTVE